MINCCVPSSSAKGEETSLCTTPPFTVAISPIGMGGSLRQVSRFCKRRRERLAAAWLSAVAAEAESVSGDSVVVTSAGTVPKDGSAFKRLMLSRNLCFFLCLEVRWGVGPSSGKELEEGVSEDEVFFLATSGSSSVSVPWWEPRGRLEADTLGRFLYNTEMGVGDSVREGGRDGGGEWEEERGGMRDRGR